MNPSAQRALAHVLLSLPAPVLRAFSGGVATYRGGRTLDPRLQMLAAAAARSSLMALKSPEDARRAETRRSEVVRGRREAGVRTEAVTIPGASPVTARLYRPQDQDSNAPVIVYGHGGGGVIGDLETADVFCALLAKIVRAPVLSVDYRLAPEHRFPAGLEDMLAAFRWARTNALRLGAPPGRAAIGGEAIGGAFAAAVTQDLKAQGEPQPDLQILICPWLDMASETASMTTYAEAYPLSRPQIDWSRGHYMGPEADPADPRVSPLRSPDLSGLSPAIVVTAGFDPLIDQGEAYARALRAAGGHVIYRCYDGLAHGFTGFGGAVPGAEVASREIAGLVREGFEGRIP